MSEKFYDPTIHKNLILTKKSDEIAYLDMGDYRAVLSCGHVCDPNSLTNWCESILNNGGVKFNCPVNTCGKIWPYDEVRRVALLTQNEKFNFETKLNNNMSRSLGFKSCPKCDHFIQRDEININKAVCLNCSHDEFSFEFCWRCDQKWLNNNSVKSCGNRICLGYDQETLDNCKFIYLAQCPKLGKVPSVRACPSCDVLIEHDGSGCKNIICNQCKLEFCFACLETTVLCQKMKHGYYEYCSKPIAPIQTKKLQIYVKNFI